jgi:hypothetical protein
VSATLKVHLQDVRTRAARVGERDGDDARRHRVQRRAGRGRSRLKRRGPSPPTTAVRRAHRSGGHRSG